MPFVPDAAPAATGGRFVPDAAPQPTGFGTRVLDTAKDVAAVPFRVLGTAADVGSRLSAALDPSQAGAPLPNYGEHNLVPAALQHAPVVGASPPNLTLGGVAANLGGRLVNSLHGPLADTIKENAPAAATLSGAVLGAPGLVRGGAAAMNGTVDALEGMGAPKAPNVPVGGVEHPIVQVQRNGFQIAPNDIPRVSSTPASDVPGTTRQGMTETPAITAARNQANTVHATRIAAQDIGLPPTDIITPEHTAAARIPPGATYDRVGAAVGGIEKPLTDAPAALDAAVNDNSQYAMPPKAKAQADRVSQGLQSGKYTGPQIIQDISYFRTVPGGKDVADALEGELGAQVQAKAPAMQGDYQDARTMFAKVRDVEDSLNGSVVNPQKLKQMRDGPRERPLSGGLNDIAEAAAQAPNSVKLPGAVTGGEVPLSKVGILTRAAKGAVRPFVPMPSQANIAASARGGGPIPMGPPQRGLPGLGDSLAQ
jgi:hypothetical protein